MHTLNDPVHGTIHLTDREVQVIDHPYFQRLRRVKALGMLDRVFPGARHSRFEHSIGACHVAGRLFEDVKRVSGALADRSWSKKSLHQPLSAEDLDEVLDTDAQGAFRLASLLHDVGHGPFSHASEPLMPTVGQLVDANAEAISDRVASALLSGKSPQDRSDHEDYSLILAERILREVGTPEEETLRCLCFKDSRMEVPKSVAPAQATVFGQLVSGELDSDRMDYLRRDSLFCGVPFGHFDFDRLMDGLCLVRETHNGQDLAIAIKRGAVSALEDYLFSRFQMHVQVYTHRVDQKCNVALRVTGQSSGYTLPVEIEEYVELDDENLCDKAGDRLSAFASVAKRREMWEMVHESYSHDELVDPDLVHGLTQDLPKESWGRMTSRKLIRKPALLNLPVLGTTFADEYTSNKLQAISKVIADYNTVFSVKRLFVAPDYVDLVTKRKAQMSGKAA